MVPVEISAVNRSLQMSPSYLPLAAPAWGTNLEELTGHLPNQPWQPALRSLDDRTQQYNRIQHQKTHTRLATFPKVVYIYYMNYMHLWVSFEIAEAESERKGVSMKFSYKVEPPSLLSLGFKSSNLKKKWTSDWLGSDDQQSGDGASNGTHAATSFYSPKVWLRLHFICPWGSFMRSRPSTLFRCRWIVWNAFKRTSTTASAP